MKGRCSPFQSPTISRTVTLPFTKVIRIWRGYSASKLEIAEPARLTYVGCTNIAHLFRFSPLESLHHSVSL